MSAKVICAIWIATATVPVPPPEFDIPYKGKLTTIVLPSMDVHAACRGAPRTERRIMACALLADGHCIIVVPRVEPGVVSEGQQKRLIRHELGHCNLWGADHFGAVFARKRETPP